MRGIHLALETPDWWWCTRLARRFPALGIRFMHLVPIASARSVATVELRGWAAQRATAWLTREGLLYGGLVLRQAPGAATLRVATRRCPLTAALFETHFVPQFPFSVRGGEIHWLVLGQNEPSTELYAACRRHGIRIRRLEAAPLEAAREDLTEHQRRVLQMAVQAGYYDHPRRITLTDLATRIGVAKSTLSEMLMVVEHKITHAHVNDDAVRLRSTTGRQGAVSAAAGWAAPWARGNA